MATGICSSGGGILDCGGLDYCVEQFAITPNKIISGPEPAAGDGYAGGNGWKSESKKV